MYRKIKADTIFDGYRFLPGNKVLICNAAGSVEAVVDDADAGDDISIIEGMLSPGFINTHCHIELSHLKGKIPEHTGLVNFVQQVMSGRESSATEKALAMQQAADELYESGTVAIGDICNTADSIALKRHSHLHWHNFIELSGFVDAGAGKRFEAACVLAESFNELPFVTTLTPHAPYSVSKTLFALLNNASANKIISIHNQETAAEDELYLTKTGGFLELYKNFGIDISDFQPTGKSSLQTWWPYFDKQQSVIAVHNVFTTKSDLDFIAANKNKDIFFCLCPNANLYIENRLPQVHMLMENLPGTAITLGTDSYASNRQLNIWAEVKSLQQGFPDIPLETILRWATSNGAKALGIDHQFGSFEKGKTPGIVQISQVEDIQHSSAKRLV